MNFTRVSSWGKIRRPNHSDALQQDTETGAHKGFSRTTFVFSSFHGFVTSHFHPQPAVYLSSAHTDVAAPGVSFLTEEGVAAPSWWLGGPSELSEDTHKLFLWGFLPSMPLFAHFPPVARKITHLLWATTAPLSRHSSSCSTLSLILCLPALPLPQTCTG